MATKETFKTKDIMHDFKSLAAAQIYASKLAAAHDTETSVQDTAADVLAFACANKCLNSFQKLMATVRVRFGQDAVDTLNAYYIDGVPAATIAKCHGISPKNLIHLFEPWLKCAYKVRERVPLPAFPVSNEEAVKDSAILFIREARHYDYYTTQRNSLQQKLNTINHQFEPKSPSLTNNGGAIVHDPSRVEKAILDAMEKKDNLSKQIAYYTIMIAWIEECVSRMEPLWQMAFIPYCQNAIPTNVLCDTANLTEYETRRSFYINAAGVLTEQCKAEYRNIRHQYRDVLTK